MYRDEKEALKARRDALKQEVAEVENHLKAIDNLKKIAMAKRWREVYFDPYAGPISAALVFLTGLAVAMLPPMFEPQTESNTSCADEHGVSAPEPAEMAQMREDVLLTPRGENVSLSTSCDVVNNNCRAADDEPLNVVFMLDTSPSMKSELRHAKEAISEYIRESNATYFLLVTTSGARNGNMFASDDRTKFASAVSQVQVDSKVSEEDIPLLLEETAWTAYEKRFTHTLIFAFTDEEPQWPSPIEEHGLLLQQGISFCSLPSNRITFTVFTTPENVSAWREFVPCLGVYGDL